MQRRTTRHKSCVACIQTKRKCDRTQPKCQRCMTRGSNCQYLGRQQEVVVRSAVDTAADWQLQALEAEPMDRRLLFSPSSSENIFEFPNHPFNQPIDNQSFVPSIGDLVTQPHPPTTDPDAKIYARVEYCAARLSLLPHVFSASGQTMFIHRQIFQVYRSPALQQAMSACALYCIRTPTTKPLVHQVLQHNVQHLLATTNPTVVSNSDLLAGLQALLLYQLMRLFDGDIRLRTSAEADEPTAILWASVLRTRACALALPLDPILRFPNNPEDWHAWLLSESMRRTVVTTFLLRGVYNYLRTGNDSPTAMDLHFTVQESLWNSQSELRWNRARNEKIELQALVNAWDEVMVLASPTDLEELGVLVMSMLWGLRATQNWLGHEFSLKYNLDSPLLP
ncbi:hypothetical protein IQ07DRAFT_665001 [Pyrenochaeta sp. DS3sAY3a]|nr:hypothetical protein IQ07DRAFT_665001 [Pyrenochaeta sp. DS3sAY3a]